jgi:hypothetical protein
MVKHFTPVELGLLHTRSEKIARIKMCTLQLLAFDVLILDRSLILYELRI